MAKTVVSEDEAVQAFANLVNFDLIAEVRSLRYVIEKMRAFYETIGVVGASDQMMIASGRKRPRLPINRSPGFFDQRIEDISWEDTSSELFLMFEIRRYIQLDRGENDTSLDCKLYFRNLSLGDSPKGAYVEIFEHENVGAAFDKFMQHPAVAPVLDRTPDHLLGYATTVW